MTLEKMSSTAKLYKTPTQKKPIFSGFKEKPRLPLNYEEEQWHRLKETVDAIHLHRSVGYSLEDLCQSVENLCNHHMSAGLFDKLYQVCKAYTESLKHKFLKDCSDSDDFLRFTNTVWLHFCEEMKSIRNIFLMLDRTYVLQQSHITSIWDMGVDLFRSIILKDGVISQRLIRGLLVYVEKERRQETVDRSLLKTLLRMLTELQIYDMFERPFLEETDQLYKEEGLRLSGEMELPTYILHVNTRLTEEQDRLIHYLNPHTKKELICLVEKNLIKDHVKSSYLEKGLDQLMSDSRLSDLSLLYSLCYRVNSLNDLALNFTRYLKKAGRNLVRDEGPEKDKTMVQSLLDFKEKVDRIVIECFKNNEVFQYKRKEAFEDFINSRQNKPAEFIAKFVDMRLRAGNKELTEDELEHSLDRIMVLFRYIHGKDTFEAFYKKDLAKRLLLSKSASVDAEKSMLAKLKQECGSAFTAKLEGMFKDIEVSRDIMVSFKSHMHCRHESQRSLDLYVNVLTTGFWPTYDQMKGIQYPPVILKCQNDFNNFYLSKHNGRTLKFQPKVSTCALKVHFKKVQKELQVSMVQALVLLRFNSNATNTYDELKQATGIEDDELTRTLQSLSLNKVTKILIKEVKEKSIATHEKFTFNEEFTHRQYKIKINTVQGKETPAEQSQTHEKVFQDRQYQVDAAVVRIMKMRKKLTHTALITELFEQLKFPVKAQDLKRRIESLMERDYMERDSEANGYVYKA